MALGSQSNFSFLHPSIEFTNAVAPQLCFTTSFTRPPPRPSSPPLYLPLGFWSGAVPLPQELASLFPTPLVPNEVARGQTTGNSTTNPWWKPSKECLERQQTSDNRHPAGPSLYEARERDVMGLVGGEMGMGRRFPLRQPSDIQRYNGTSSFIIHKRQYISRAVPQ